jgi:hypothetical protein
MKKSFVQATLVAGGVLYVVTAAALLFAPVWFFENVGSYAPYNRHFIGDAGSFVLALGLVLLWAVRDPIRYRGMIAIVGLSSLAHAINHVMDDFVLNPSTFSIVSNLSLFIVAFAILLAAWWAAPQRRTAMGLSGGS